jgi:hypothetical protein
VEGATPRDKVEGATPRDKVEVEVGCIQPLPLVAYICGGGISSCGTLSFSSSYSKSVSLGSGTSSYTSSSNSSTSCSNHDPDLCKNTMKYINTHKYRDVVEIRLHFINNK